MINFRYFFLVSRSTLKFVQRYCFSLSSARRFDDFRKFAMLFSLDVRYSLLEEEASTGAVSELHCRTQARIPF